MTESFYIGSGGAIIDLSKDSKAGYIKEQVGTFEMGITYDNMDKKKNEYKNWRKSKLKSPENSGDKPINSSYTYEF